MIKLREGYTLPNPELDFSSRRFDIEVEAPTYEEALAQLKDLSAKEQARKFPDLFVANDKLTKANRFIKSLIKDPAIGQLVQSKLTAFLE